MPRIIFDDPNEFKKWVRYFISAEKYVAMQVPENMEIIIAPLKSTRPLYYLYYRATSCEELDDILNLLKSLGIKIFNVGGVDWNLDRPVGMG